MERFQYTRARTVPEAIGIAAQSTTAQQSAPIRFVAGGTTLVDLMKPDVERPSRLVDINHLGLNAIEPTADGGLKDRALVLNSALALGPAGMRTYRVLSYSLLSCTS